MSNTQSIDLIPFLSEAMSTNVKIYKSIDRLYNTNPKLFYENGKQHDFYNHQMATEGNLEQEYYFKKSISILSSVNSLEPNAKENLENEIINILEKGWKYSTTYAKNHKKIMISDFIGKYIKKYKGLDNISDNDLNSAILVMVIVADTYSVEVDNTDSFYNTFVQALSQRLLYYKGNNRISLDTESNTSKRQLRDLELKLLSRNKFLYLPLGKIMPSGDLQDASNEDKSLIAFDYIYDFEKLSLVGMVGDTFLSSKEIQEIILCYTSLFRDDDINILELERFVYAASQVRYLCKEYKRAKSFFFSNHQEKLYNDISELNCKIEILNTTNNKLESDNSILVNENNRLSIENKRLLAELEKTSANNKELISLREHIFSATDEVHEVIQTEPINLDSINSIKGIIIGGSSAWQLRMKKKLHTWTFINADSLNFDKNLLNKDYVFINTSYLSHSMYYKVVENLGANTCLSYINKSNIDICLHDIYYRIKNNNED